MGIPPGIRLGLSLDWVRTEIELGLGWILVEMGFVLGCAEFGFGLSWV